MLTPEYKQDDYSRQRDIQNAGGVCEHCGAALGHYSVCSLFGGALREAQAEKFYRPWPKDVPQDVQWLETLYNLQDDRG